MKQWKIQMFVTAFCVVNIIATYIANGSGHTMLAWFAAVLGWATAAINSMSNDI